MEGVGWGGPTNPLTPPPRCVCQHLRRGGHTGLQVLEPVGAPEAGDLGQDPPDLGGTDSRRQWEGCCRGVLTKTVGKHLNPHHALTSRTEGVWVPGRKKTDNFNGGVELANPLTPLGAKKSLFAASFGATGVKQPIWGERGFLPLVDEPSPPPSSPSGGVSKTNISGH